MLACIYITRTRRRGEKYIHPQSCPSQKRGELNKASLSHNALQGVDLVKFGSTDGLELN
jgi:hypothetical protein